MVPAWVSRVIPVLRLARVSTAFAAVSNVWFVILWSREHEFEQRTGPVWDAPLALLLLGGGVMAIGLYAYGAALNDLLDVSRDRAFKRQRPLPTGGVSVELASAAVAFTMILAVLGSTVFGTRGVVLTVLLTLAILVFNAAARFVPAVGLVLLALIYAAHSLVPNLSLRFVWPVWLIMTHALGVAWAAHAIGRKVPPISQRAIVAAGGGWLAASGILLFVGYRRSLVPGLPEDASQELWPVWVEPWVAVAPLALVVVFVLFAWRRVSEVGLGQRAAEKLTRYGALWMPLYGCAWLLGAGLVGEGLVLALLAGVALLGLTVLREVYAVVERPIEYRR
ncbi:MAG: hypothetical protein AAGI17_09360 [Planctomycetota bacterium]